MDSRSNTKILQKVEILQGDPTQYKYYEEILDSISITRTPRTV